MADHVQCPVHPIALNLTPLLPSLFRAKQGCDSFLGAENFLML